MGYTTEFKGRFIIDRAVEPWLVNYINLFSRTRHMKCENEKIKELFPDWELYCYKGQLGSEGEYFVKDTEMALPDSLELTSQYVLDINTPPKTQPGLWCDWIIPADNHATIEWNGAEKFYNYQEWLQYLIDNFLAPNNYVVNGIVRFKGEYYDDVGYLEVINNHVRKVFYTDLM